MLRWIDELNNITDTEKSAHDIKIKIRKLKKETSNIENKRKIKKLYDELDNIQFKSDYLCLIIDKNKDYYRACNGFSINNINYVRLLGTNGGIKNNTIVFVNKNLSTELQRRINNGRNMNKELVVAKLEAYKALTCSASIPVSTPKGILIVNDAETEFLSDVFYITDENSDEPLIKKQNKHKIKINASDGYGIMLPSLAAKWSEELGLDYIVSGVNTRFSFEKGMIFTFDFIDFADKIAKKYIVKDAWGDEVDVRNVDIILTTSMVKLWDSYDSCKNYIDTSLNNNYTFSVTKTCPKTLENQRNLNYQFIQSYNLNDNDIESLIAPTIKEFKDVLHGDWRKTVLFLKGSGITDSNIDYIDNDYAKAIMINKDMLNDPFIKNSIYQLIRNRINQAKVGVLRVHGNYSIISGDPYLLCQSIFNLEKTGLLREGEIYNEYWANNRTNNLACFRAPMTCHNNVRIVKSVNTQDVRYWYKYMSTCTILNSWDTTTAALNGCDFDGDLIMLTDNDVLVKKHKSLPALLCAQRKASKCIPIEEDFVHSNIDSFGNGIGQTTNWITSMFEARANFERNSIEYKTLSYRIKCGQLFQQNVIDKSKGIIAKPMPREWHDKHTVNKMDNIFKKELYSKIAADKKPYFMRYIYPSLMKQYNTYIKNTNRNALREFKMTIAELNKLDKLTDTQKEFLQYYKYKMPVGTSNCVMNKICRRFEEEFDKYIYKYNSSNNFDYTIMKYGEEYSSKQYNSIKKIYKDYNEKLINFSVLSNYERIDEADSYVNLSMLNENFKKECDKICSNSRTLCDIILDVCYSKHSTKRFAWNMCGEQIISNLLLKNKNNIFYPVADTQGDFKFCENTYKINNKKIEV